MSGRVSVSIVIPYRPAGGGYRDRAFDFVRTRYAMQYPDAEIIDDRPYGAEWSKGEAVDRALQRATGEIVVVADADLYVSQDAIDWSIDAIVQGEAWSMPHGLVFRLSADTTHDLYALNWPAEPRHVRPRFLDRVAHTGPPGGGIVVGRRETFLDVPLDPRFTDWGGEDISWARALDRLAGPCRRFRAPMLHLWHPPMEREPGGRASAENEALAGRYLDAIADIDAMRVLTTEAKIALGKVAVEHED